MNYLSNLFLWRVKILIVFLGSFFFLFSSCNSKENNLISFVNEKSEMKESSLDTMFSLLKYVKLETLPESLIGNKISKIRKYNGKYYISTDHKELLIFLEDGSFVRKINRLGNGPQEYTMLADFDLSPNNDIVILDVKKIIIYDENGNYKKEVSLPVTGFNIKDLNGQEALICASGEEHVIYRCDYNGQILEKWLKNKKATSIGSDVPFIAVSDSQVVFQIGFSVDFVSYNTRGKKFTEIRLFGGNECVTTKKEDKLLEQYGFDYLYKFSDLKILFGVASCRDYMLFKLGNDDGHRVYVADLKKNNELKYKSTFIKEEQIKNTLRIDYAHIGIAEDCFISYIPYQEFVLMQGRDDEAVLEDENPVLVEFVVK
jgi:hypothetical protein